MYLQPKIDLTSGRLGGAEALVRWTTGTGRMLYPDQFIPLFEQNGFSVSLDLYMVECACKQLRAWLDQGIQPPPLSVNQSKLLLFEADYIQNLERLIERYQIPASWITLEILEGLALENAGELNARISQLQATGFRISMDDFGSGYSSLNTLNSLQIDELKLDRGFPHGGGGQERFPFQGHHGAGGADGQTTGDLGGGGRRGDTGERGPHPIDGLRFRPGLLLQPPHHGGRIHRPLLGRAEGRPARSGPVTARARAAERMRCPGLRRQAQVKVW